MDKDTAFWKGEAEKYGIAYDHEREENERLSDEREKVRWGMEVLFGDGGETFAAYERVLQAGEEFIGRRKA